MAALRLVRLSIVERQGTDPVVDVDVSLRSKLDAEHGLEAPPQMWNAREIVVITEGKGLVVPDAWAVGLV